MRWIRCRRLLKCRFRVTERATTLSCSDIWKPPDWRTKSPPFWTKKRLRQSAKKIGARVLYHSDLPTDGTIASARRTQQQLQTGATAYASCGVHGSGTYLDTDAASNAICYGYGGTQVKLFINRNAKLARSSDLLQAESNFRVKHPKTYAYLQGLDKKLGKHRKSEIKTIYLTAAGYNVFSRPNGYKVAYSRKALTICNVMKDASTVTTNW